MADLDLLNNSRQGEEADREEGVDVPGPVYSHVLGGVLADRLDSLAASSARRLLLQGKGDLLTNSSAEQQLAAAVEVPLRADVATHEKWDAARRCHHGARARGLALQRAQLALLLLLTRSRWCALARAAARSSTMWRRAGRRARPAGPSTRLAMGRGAHRACKSSVHGELR